MKSAVCELLGIEFPLIAFSHCRDVVAAVSKAGGFGVLGLVDLPPERIEEELTWIDEHIDGKPYGVDIIVPNKFEGKQGLSDEDLLASISQEHKDFASSIMQEYGVDEKGKEEEFFPFLLQKWNHNIREEGAKKAMDAVFKHPIKLIANALGIPPQIMIDRARENDVVVAALTGAKKHALQQVEAGVDLIVVAGNEAGGHTSDVGTMVLLPEVVNAVREVSDVPILAAGGIATGSQMAAAMAMGADGVWCGSVWLTTAEAETVPAVKEKMLAASSRDTVRSRSRTGKPSRQLRSPWTDAWEKHGPDPLPMPHQSFVSEPNLLRIDKLSQGNHEGAKQLATYWVGQAIGLMNQPMSAGAVVQAFKEDFLAAYERLVNTLEE